MISMTRGSMETLKMNYENAVCLRNLVNEIYDTLSKCSTDFSEIEQETIDYFKNTLDKIRRQSSNSFLIIEIMELLSWLCNISSFRLPETMRVCKERRHYLDTLITCFNPSSFKKM